MLCCKIGMSQITIKSSGMERSIHEMLKDAPPLNESDNAVHTGTPPPHVPNNCTSDNHPRPATINLNLGSPTSQTRIILPYITFQNQYQCQYFVIF